jgi:transposase
MQHRDFRSLTSEAQEATRQRAVAALRSGMSQIEAARTFGVTRQAVGNWMEVYNAMGTAGLRAKKRGRPPGISLEGWQAAQIVRSILDRCPDQLKLPYCLWTREAAAALINERFGIELSVWTAGRYLARWDLTSQKPRRRAVEQDREDVRRWLEHRYPSIRDHAKRVGAEIYWADEMGVRSDRVAGRSHGRRRHTPVIPGAGKRFGCNMISAITNRDHLVFMVFKGRFVSKVFIDFLSRLHEQVGGRVVVILDSHPVHKSAEVRRWIKETNGEMELYFLPGYSPELNLNE